MKKSNKIVYRYLNMDTKKFVTEIELISQTGKGLVRAIPNYKKSFVIVAAGNRHFTEYAAHMLGNKLYKLETLNEASAR